MEEKDRKRLARIIGELEEFATRKKIHLLGIATYMEKDKEITHWLMAGDLDIVLNRIRERFSDAIKNLEKNEDFYKKSKK